MAEAPTHGHRTLEWNDFQLICERVAEHGQKRRACEELGFKYQTVAGAISSATSRDDHEWQSLWDESHAAYCERIEGEIHRRAIEGVTKKVWGRVDKDLDGEIGEEVTYSDSLLALQAKGNIPKYQQRQLIAAGGGLEIPDVFAQLSPKARKLVRDIIVADLADQHSKGTAEELSAGAGEVQQIEHQTEPKPKAKAKPRPKPKGKS